jgi:hypothetical protein
MAGFRLARERRTFLNAWSRSLVANHSKALSQTKVFENGILAVAALQKLRERPWCGMLRDSAFTSPSSNRASQLGRLPKPRKRYSSAEVISLLGLVK